MTTNKTTSSATNLHASQALCCPPWWKWRQLGRGSLLISFISIAYDCYFNEKDPVCTARKPKKGLQLWKSVGLRGVILLLVRGCLSFVKELFQLSPTLTVSHIRLHSQVSHIQKCFLFLRPWTVCHVNYARKNSITRKSFPGIVLPGHAKRLQGLVSRLSPEQSLPPCCGAGLLHSRDRVCSPPLQTFEHSVHSVHVDQFPSTEKEHPRIKSEWGKA